RFLFGSSCVYCLAFQKAAEVTMIEIGIMGGSFNPIHTRHLMVAQCALDQFHLLKVIIVPSGAPPHKVGMLDREPRFLMCSAAVADNSRMEVSRTEIDR